MRKLFKFLRKFRDFLIFFVLQIIVLGFFFNSRNYHKAQLFNTSSVFISWFVEKKYNITKHFDLEETNQKLMLENAYLLSKSPQSFYRLQDRIYYIQDTLYKQQYEYVPAEVLNSTTTKRDNYFTLNKGSLTGIRKGMGVMSKEGIVGFVFSVNDHFSTVKTVLSDNINIPVKLKKNNEHWLLKWDGYDQQIAQVNGVNRDIDIAVGDTVVTRAGKGMFPSGIMVGVVDELISQDGKQTWDVNIRLAVDFSSVTYVYVIKNLFQNEQRELELRLFENE
ncbi:MAG: rod shape-determining protein MreC [Crocinitomicaceae bacterium]|nr:rod shape-determining protein MreC [Crocinitomicaceae bacterium]MBK9590015.1 rod shape-determining protein MreC [Crocinitomicaceae bacterium]